MMTSWGGTDTDCEAPSLEVRLTASMGTGAEVAPDTDGGVTADVEAGGEKE